MSDTTNSEDSPDAELTELPSGLRYADQAVGDGDETKTGQQVTVHYVGTLSDGSEFDSSRRRDDPFRFVLGQGVVIRGWDEGIAGMRVGGRRRLVIPPHLAYGARGAGHLVPANATLVFEVELLRAG